MTDKDKMREEFERWYEAKQMPSESNWFKKYGEENASNEYWYEDTQDAWETWQAAKESDRQRIADLEAVERMRDEEIAALREKHGGCLEQIELLEKKLAAQEWACKNTCRMITPEELTKREAAAFARGNGDGYAMGFFAGKQAGRDEVLTKLSEQEPVAWKFEEAVPAYANEKGRCTTPGNKRLLSFAAPDFTDSNIHHVVQLIPRPNKPEKE